jgi:hypothetical protein
MAHLRVLTTSARVMLRFLGITGNALSRSINGATVGRHARRYLANECQSEWAARARRSLKFCEIQIPFAEMKEPRVRGSPRLSATTRVLGNWAREQSHLVIVGLGEPQVKMVAPNPWPQISPLRDREEFKKMGATGGRRRPLVFCRQLSGEGDGRELTTQRLNSVLKRRSWWYSEKIL